MSSTLQTEILSDRDFETCETRTFRDGEVALFTRRAPYKEPPADAREEPDAPRNEDAIALFDCGRHGGVIALADGMGGLPGGAAAAREALDCLENALRPAAEGLRSLRESILLGIDRANEAVCELESGTTLVVCELQGEIVRTYHVGDSFALVSGLRGRRKHLTVFHTPVGQAVEAGLLTSRQAMQHPERHLLTNALGHEQMRIEIGHELQMALHDTLLLASDGLADNLFVEEMVETIRKGPLQRSAEDLVELCRERMTRQDGAAPSKADDLALVLYRRKS